MSETKQLVIFGAGGRVGAFAIKEALARGLTVRAVLRHPEQLHIRHQNLSIVTGDVLRRSDVEAGVLGMHAVVSTVGQRRGSARDTMEIFARNLVPAMQAARVERVVTLLGAGVSLPDDGPASFGRRLVIGAMKLLARHVLEDAQHHADALRASDLRWTIVRPPRIVDGPPRAHIQAAPFLSLGAGDTIVAEDVARFMIGEALEERFVRQAPMVASTDKA